MKSSRWAVREKWCNVLRRRLARHIPETTTHFVNLKIHSYPRTKTETVVLTLQVQGEVLVFLGNPSTFPDETLKAQIRLLLG